MNSYIQFSQIPSSSGGPPNFSFNLVDTGESVTVPDGQEMIITQDLVVLGDIMVDGLVTQLPDYEDNCSFWTRIPLNKSIVIQEDRLMLYKSPFTVLGNLRVLGDLMEVA